MIEVSESDKKIGLEKLTLLCNSNLYVGNNPILKYLHSRGISDHTITKFKIGGFPTDCELVSKFMGQGAAFKLGIISRDEGGKLYSRFTDNGVIVPIYDEYGKSIAIIGRYLYSEKKRERAGIAKYINTSFKKGNCLFGLNLAIDSIRRKNKVYVVEGNFDVMTAFQHGLTNVVATSGTMLTRQQIIMLARYTDDIKILFDNDEAGQISANKAVRKYQGLGLKIEKIELPKDVKDLDEYFSKYDNIEL